METFSVLLAFCAENSPAHKGQWRGALMFSLICTWINSWVNNPEAGDLRRHRTHCDVSVMSHLCMTVFYSTQGNRHGPLWVRYQCERNLTAFCGYVPWHGCSHMMPTSFARPLIGGFPFVGVPRWVVEGTRSNCETREFFKTVPAIALAWRCSSGTVTAVTVLSASPVLSETHWALIQCKGVILPV